jgi:hypothetical protein
MAAVRAFWRHAMVYNGEVIGMFQPCDTCTHPDFQRLGLFTRLTRLAIDEAKHQHARALFNFPNSNSRPGYLKLGWRSFDGLLALVKLVTPMKVGLSFFKERCSLGDFEPFSRQTDILGSEKETMKGFQDLDSWPQDDAFNVRDRFSSLRTPKWTRWRFYHHPTREYVAVQYEGVAAIICLGTRSGLTESMIVDIYGYTHIDKRILKRLLHEIIEQFPVDIVSVRITRGHPATPLLRSSGFIRLKDNSYVTLPLGEDHPYEDAGNWAILGADIDYL